MRRGTAAALCLLALSLASVCVSADGSDAGNGYLLEDGVLTVTAVDFVPPDDAEWTAARNGAHSVVLSEGVVSLGGGAFSGCPWITDLKVSGTVERIGDDAFRGTGIVSADIPDSVSVIGDRAFSGCASLTSVSLGGGLRTAGDGAFSDCTSVMTLDYGCPMLRARGSGLFSGTGADGMTVSFTNGTDSVPAEMFMGSGVGALVFGTWPVSVGDRAFSGCPLRSMDSSLLGSIGDGAFSGTLLTEAVLPARTGMGAFSGCTVLASADLSAVDEVPDGLFYGCGSLNEITFSKDMKRIGARAFWGTGVTDLMFPIGFMSIGDGAFAECPVGSAVFLDRLSYAGSGCIPSGADLVLQTVDGHGALPFGEPAGVMMRTYPDDGMFPDSVRITGTGDAVTYVLKEGSTVLPADIPFPDDMVPDRDSFLGWHIDGEPAEPAEGAVLTGLWDGPLPAPEPPEDRSAEKIVFATASLAVLMSALLLLRRTRSG